MMWAATVRRCPTGHARHQSQFGARMQIARALNHAPYLICDGVYTPCENDIRYGIPCESSPQDHEFICEPHVQHSGGSDSPFVNSENNISSISPHPWTGISTAGPWTHQQSESSQAIYNNRMNRRQYATSSNLNETPPYLTCSRSSLTCPRNGSRNSCNSASGGDMMRVELPYSRRQFESLDDYPGEPIVRRYEDFRIRDQDDSGVVGLSYQQRSIRGPGPYNGGEVWGAEPSIDCWGDRPLLLKRGRTREIVRTFFVVGSSLTFITSVIMGFGVYNMLITTLFLFFLLSTVSLLIFLLMRKPSCFNCCREPFDLNTNTEDDTEVQQGLSTYLTETQGVVLKKRLTDSPPPYESPPDYHSLPPEVLVNARSLSGLDTPGPETLIARVHGNYAGEGRTADRLNGTTDQRSRTTDRRSRIRRFAARSSTSLLASAAPLLSSSSAEKRATPPASPSVRLSG